MRRDESAYAVLGLRPGTSRAQVDEAYRRLIKLHHPDRNGGDGRRAAEINHAYTLLRRDLPARPTYRSVPVRVQPVRRPRQRPRFAWLALGCLVGGAAMFAMQDSARAPLVRYGAAVPQSLPQQRASVRLDDPINMPVVDSAIGEANRFHSIGDVAGAAEYSRECSQSLRSKPSLPLFDACAAFDEAIVTLGIADPAYANQFDGSVVLGRQLAAARSISNDMLAADSRLHQIRSRVDLALLPRLDEAASYPQR